MREPIKIAWASEEFEGMKPTVYDWARMAAFIDGEGHISICANRTSVGNRRYQARIIISNTNPVLPNWLKETFGGFLLFRDVQKRNPKAKQVYIWNCTSQRAAWILHNCMPWLILKGAQAKILMELQECINKSRTSLGAPIALQDAARREDLKQQLHKLNARGSTRE